MSCHVVIPYSCCTRHSLSLVGVPISTIAHGMGPEMARLLVDVPETQLMADVHPKLSEQDSWSYPMGQ